MKVYENILDGTANKTLKCNEVIDLYEFSKDRRVTEEFIHTFPKGIIAYVNIVRLIVILTRLSYSTFRAAIQYAKRKSYEVWYIGNIDLN